jgi:hypothetical protein
LVESVPCEAACGWVTGGGSPRAGPPRRPLRRPGPGLDFEPADGSSRRKFDHPFADDVPESAAVGVAGAGAGGTRDGNPTPPTECSSWFFFEKRNTRACPTCCAGVAPASAAAPRRIVVHERDFGRVVEGLPDLLCLGCPFRPSVRLAPPRRSFFLLAGTLFLVGLCRRCTPGDPPCIARRESCAVIIDGIRYSISRTRGLRWSGTCRCLG